MNGISIARTNNPASVPPGKNARELTPAATAVHQPQRLRVPHAAIAATQKIPASTSIQPVR